jgi:hypothetical protein
MQTARRNALIRNLALFSIAGQLPTALALDAPRSWRGRLKGS